MPIETASAASAAEISSSTMRYVTVASAMPSYSSGVHMPRNPSAPRSLMVWCGNSPVRSHSAAKGSIFSFANSRASSTTCSRMSVTVDIEPLARFSAELSVGNHFLEQRRRPVFLRVEPVLQHLHDREAPGEPDQVGERQRTQRMIHAELHDLIDRLRGGDTFVYTEDRFVDHRHQHAVRHESGRIVDHDGRLPQRFCDLDGSFHGLVRRLWSTYYLDEFHDRHGIHEMHADVSIGPPRLLGDFGVRERRSVGCKDRTFGGEPIQLLKDVELDVRILGRRLHEDSRTLHAIERRARLDARKRPSS